MARFWAVFLLCITLVPAAGCSNNLYSGDLKDVELVRGLLVDVGEEEETTEATVLLLSRDKALEGQYAASYYQVTAAGDGLAGAVGETYRHGAKQLNFSHCQVLLLGEGAAGAALWLDWAQRSPEIRPTVYPVICQGRTADFLAASDGEGAVSPLYWLGNILGPQGSSRPGPAGVRLQNFVELLLAPGIVPVLPQVAADAEGNLELVGFAVYDVDGGAEPAGLLQGDEADCWRLTCRSGYLAGEVLSLGEREALQIRSASVGHRVTVEGERVQVIYTLKIRFKPLTNAGQLAPAELAALAEERLRQIFAAGVRRSRELGLDFLGAGREVMRREPAVWRRLTGAEYRNERGYLERLDLRLEVEAAVDEA